MKTMLLAAAITLMALEQGASAQVIKPSPFREVIKSYLDLKNFLTRDSADSAESAAERLRVAVDSVPTDSMTPAEHAVWKKFAEKLSDVAGQIRNTGDIDFQRKHFGELSVEMCVALQKTKRNSAELHYAYCPMAKAYWLSENPYISNPYLGQVMPTCGSTKDTLSVH